MNLSSLGLSALFSAQYNLKTTGHNINNAAVDGYSRQSVLLDTAGSRDMGAGYIGRGVQVVTVRRAYDGFLANQLVQSQTKGAALVAYGNEIGQVNNLFADRSSGINPAIQNFFDAMNAVASSPADTAARQELLGRAQSMVTQFNDANAFLENQRSNLNTQIRTTVTQANSYIERIADLNAQITKARASSPAHQPNDLLDQRDQLVAELNQIVDVKVHEQDGLFNLSIGNGQVVLGGTKVYPLEAQPSHEDPSRYVVAYTSSFKNGEARTVQLPDSSFKGGELGGLLSYRSESLDATQNKLGRLAVAINDQINQLHRQGYDLAGNAGGDFFNVSLKQPIPTNQSGVEPAPSLRIELTDASKLAANDYRLSFDNGQYMLQTLPNGRAQPITFTNGEYELDGMVLKIENLDQAVQGDTWLIQPTRDTAGRFELELSDPAKFAASQADSGTANGEIALQLAALQNKKFMGNGSMSFNDAFGQIVNQVAVQAQQNGTAAKAQAKLIEQNFAAQQRVSGVNLDEEYLQLQRYVEQYQAASRLIDVSSTLFDTLLALRS